MATFPACNKGSDKICTDAALPYGPGSCCAYNYADIGGTVVDGYVCKTPEEIVGMAALGDGKHTVGDMTVQAYCAGAAKLAVGALASAAIYTTM